MTDRLTYSSCPTAVVDAPVHIVWALLTEPTGWGDVFDVRITRAIPDGNAVVGQKVYAESGPTFLHLKVEFQFAEVDPERYQLGLAVRLPFGLAVRENLVCVPLGANQCRVSYRCDFSFPAGWRGPIVSLLMYRTRDTGPIESLSNLKRAAERLHAFSRA